MSINPENWTNQAKCLCKYPKHWTNRAKCLFKYSELIEVNFGFYLPVIRLVVELEAAGLVEVAWLGHARQRQLPHPTKVHLLQEI